MCFPHYACQAIIGCTKHSPEKKFSQPLMFEESTPNRQVCSHFSAIQRNTALSRIELFVNAFAPCHFVTIIACRPNVCYLHFN
jgi:hypothetical protein